MRTIDDLEVSYAPVDRPKVEVKPSFTERLEHRKLIVLALLTLIALAVRVYQLDAVGLAEDETNKMFAIRSFEQGDFTANADHPMVMKMLCYSSLHMAEAWNDTAGSLAGLTISEETALRLPNALFGALTVIPLLLFASSLLGFRVGLIASLLWALGLNAVWINRVGKEDTLLVFFILTAFYLYNRAKRCQESDVSGQERLYTLAGMAFGLMLASKYFPQYFGLNALFYYLAGYDRRNNRALTRRMWLKFFGAMILAFALFNPAAFLPKTWRYLWEFVSENLITHHGYPFMDGLYQNALSAMTDGMPLVFLFSLSRDQVSSAAFAGIPHRIDRSIPPPWRPGDSSRLSLFEDDARLLVIPDGACRLEIPALHADVDAAALYDGRCRRSRDVAAGFIGPQNN